MRALEDGRTRWLVLAGLAVGLGFETKMAAALLRMLLSLVHDTHGRSPAGAHARR